MWLQTVQSHYVEDLIRQQTEDIHVVPCAERHQAYLWLRHACPIDPAKQWTDSNYLKYDLAKPSSRSDFDLDSVALGGFGNRRVQFLASLALIIITSS